MHATDLPGEVLAKTGAELRERYAEVLGDPITAGAAPAPTASPASR